MKMNLKTTIAAAALAFVGFAAYAENVTISTYYPSPYGSYQTLEVTGGANLASASGNIGIGATPEAWAKLDVHVGNNEGVHIYRNGTGGLLLGYNGASVYGRTSADANGPLYLNPIGGQGVAIGTATAPTYMLDVAGTARVQDLRTTGDVFMVTNTSAQAGELQVDCSAGACYALAVYS